MKSNFEILCIALFIAIGFTSCGDDKDTHVSVDVELNADGKDLNYDTIYELNGYNVKFDNVSMYLNDVKIGLDNQTYSNPDQYMLLKPGTLLTLDLGNVEGSKLENISFNIGVDATTNSLTEDDFNSRPTTDPLAAQDPSMHWSWNAGYRFIRIDAAVDLDGDDSYESSLTYHIGTDAFFTSIVKTPNLDVKEGENNFNIDIDVSDILKDLDFNEESDRSTHTNNNLPLAQKVQGNLNDAITISRD